jgi:putative acetyltransferase
MIKCVKTNSTNEDFIKLVAELDKDLAIRDGDEHAFYAQFNKITMIQHAIVAYENNVTVGCGAIKPFNENTMEVKRMFVAVEQRGKGIASIILAELEKWAIELGNTKCVLETGIKQPEAIALYNKSGYTIIPSYGQYKNVTNSVCFEKILSN